MSQELNIIPRAENYVNPYKEETKKVISRLFLTVIYSVHRI